MFKRYELHNHTVHSDAKNTCEDLIRIMTEEQTDVFAITDHNTISAHGEIKALLSKMPNAPECVYGMEYTTYYGHILCLNLNRYVPWDSIDKHCPEKLFQACKQAGAVTGVAHPFSFGAPFARGCRFDMTITDFTDVDFIEIINAGNPPYLNEPALRWWEELVFQGVTISCTAGLDLHGPMHRGRQFATYIDCEPAQDVTEALIRAIRSKMTWVSCGVLVTCETSDRNCRFSLLGTKKPDFAHDLDSRYTLVLRMPDQTIEYTLDRHGIEIALPEDIHTVIPELYLGSTDFVDLVCVAPAMHF